MFFSFFFFILASLSFFSLVIFFLFCSHFTFVVPNCCDTRFFIMDYYKPEYSSPLNPSRDTQPRRNRQRRNVSTSPAQRLLRYKAAEAWRSHVLLQEAKEYERVLMETIASREVCCFFFSYFFWGLMKKYSSWLMFIFIEGS